MKVSFTAQQIATAGTKPGEKRTQGDGCGLRPARWKLPRSSPRAQPPEIRSASRPQRDPHPGRWPRRSAAASRQPPRSSPRPMAPEICSASRTAAEILTQADGCRLRPARWKPPRSSPRAQPPEIRSSTQGAAGADQRPRSLKQTFGTIRGRAGSLSSGDPQHPGRWLQASPGTLEAAEILTQGAASGDPQRIQGNRYRSEAPQRARNGHRTRTKRKTYNRQPVPIRRAA